jgi:hypothetical protein
LALMILIVLGGARHRHLPEPPNMLRKTLGRIVVLAISAEFALHGKLPFLCSGVAVFSALQITMTFRDRNPWWTQIALERQVSLLALEHQHGSSRRMPLGARLRLALVRWQGVPSAARDWDTRRMGGRAATDQHKSDSSDGGGQRADGAVIQQALGIIGAVAGLGAVVYGVGLAVMYLRFATAGFNADVALTAVPRQQIIDVGARYLVVWVILVTGLIGLLRGASRLSFPARWAFAWKSETPNAARRRTLVRFVPALALIGAAFVTWSALTVVALVIATVEFFGWYRRRYGGRRPLSPVVIFVVLASALASIGWQLEINLPYQRAYFTLAKGGAGANPIYSDTGEDDAIYFGEVDGEVYLAPRERPKFNTYTRDIIGYPRADLSELRLVPQTQTLCTSVPRPIVSFLHLFRRADQVVRQHLRRTGQPASAGHAPSAKALPLGQCPAQP